MCITVDTQASVASESGRLCPCEPQAQLAPVADLMTVVHTAPWMPDTVASLKHK